MIVRADLHVHSSYSFDGVMTLDKIVKTAKKKKIDAVAICDHNVCDIIGEIKTRCDRDGLIDGVLVIPGAEFSTDAGHIIGLFLNKTITESKNELDIIDKIYAQSGLAVFAHPYESNKKNKRRDDLISSGNTAVESFNARAESFKNGANEKATAAALDGGCIFTGGSDAHRASEIGGGYILLDVQALTSDNVMRAIYERKGTVGGECARRTPRALSQFVRRWRAREYGKIPKRIAVLIYFFISDIFVPRKKDITTIIGGESYVDNNKAW